MKKHFLIIIALTTTIGLIAQDGEKNFKSVCATCHTIGKGKLVGPDLKNVHTKYEEAWLLKWISSSQKLVKEKDEKAVAIFKQYGEIPMPDNPQFSEADLKSIIAFIKNESEKNIANNPLAASQPSNSIPNNASENQKESNSNTFIYLGVGLLILFFLSVLVILAKSIIVLSNELKNSRQMQNR